MKSLKELRKKGYRITPHRQQIMEEIKETPVTAEEIFSSLKKKRVEIDLASVYRSLAFLISNGLIHEINFRDNKKRYEIRNEENHHHHLICQSCGLVNDIKLENELQFLETIKSQTNFCIYDHSIEFFGTCKSCKIY